ncbi:hypothetical protein HPB49_001528 [Dermacentor silvarum]|uniref:Uncharacterized protein n=1 Tax=Dermacentor silvarum TaxID=543639 RepID=A0ACB8CUD7_DERSI|nr:hypothetical protein HPB49_001528 [Dermacentor silvarum]
MPTNTELAKKIELLESLLNNKLDSLVDNLAAKIGKKFDDQGFVNLASLAESVRFMSEQYDTFKATFNELLSTNKALTAQNHALVKRIADMEQYSRMNNIEIKGIPSSQGEDCSAILKKVADAI